MKSTFILLLLITFKLSSAQSSSAFNYSTNFISSKNIFSENNFKPANTEITSSEKYFISNRQNRLNIKSLLSNIDNRKKQFNPFSMQQINFTWAEIKFRFQFDVFATAGGVMQKINFFQFQNQF